MEIEQPKRPRTKKPRDYERFKVTFDLTRELSDAIYAVAVQLKCSQSDVAIHLLAEGLARYYNNELDLRSRRVRHSFSLRFTYKLPRPIVPPLPDYIAQAWSQEGDE